MGVYALLVLLILVPTRRQPPDAGGELREALDKILANNQNIELALEQQRRILNDAHKRISAVTKGLEKRPS